MFQKRTFGIHERGNENSSKEYGFWDNRDGRGI